VWEGKYRRLTFRRTPAFSGRFGDLGRKKQEDKASIVEVHTVHTGSTKTRKETSTSLCKKTKQSIVEVHSYIPVPPKRRAAKKTSTSLFTVLRCCSLPSMVGGGFPHRRQRHDSSSSNRAATEWRKLSGKFVTAFCFAATALSLGYSLYYSSSSSYPSFGNRKALSTSTTIPGYREPQREPPQQQLRHQQQQQRQRQRRSTTDAGVDLTDPDIYAPYDDDPSSSSDTATVIGMATNYDLEVYERFVGSLRKTGYQGHIILGVGPDVSQRVLQYFRYRNVTAKILSWVNCTYATAPAATNSSKDDSHRNDEIFLQKDTHCAHPYPDIKLRWSRFPLARDWLLECQTCTGPVLVSDVRDTVFQKDPFGPDLDRSNLAGLQVYEEHPSQTTNHWLTKWPIGKCKGKTYNETMLCSGTTTGTRSAMIKYLEAMYSEMLVWINDVNSCHFPINGDDQSIHNYLYYSGQLPFATAIPNRSGRGSVVNTVGVEGAIIARRHRERLMRPPHNMTHGDAMWQPFEGADISTTTNQKNRRWIGEEYNLTDQYGYFTEADGSRSRVVHQWDRFGRPYVNLWLAHQDFVKDPLPSDYTAET